MWYFGVTGGSVTGACDGNGFILSSVLNTSGWESGVTAALAAVDQSYIKYFLTVTQDQNGNYSQKLTDIFGRTLRTWADPDRSTAGDEMVASYEYDITGNVLRETPPQDGPSDNPLGASTYSYNTLNQLLSKTTPDGNAVNYTYDAAGRISVFIDAMLNAKLSSLMYSYDISGRPELTLKSDLIKQRTLYDDPLNALPYLDNTSFPQNENDLRSLLGTITNTQNRVVAVISYGEECDAEICSQKVAELHTNRDGGNLLI